MIETIRLRPFRIEDESAALGAHEAMAPEGFTFLLLHHPKMRWTDYLAGLDRAHHGVDLPPGMVRGCLLAAVAGDALVGRSSIRYELNDYLATAGGHIGYGVVAGHRRRGHATEILRQSLVVARAEGVGRVLVTCDVDNVGSAAVIERCGGSFDGIVDDPEGGPRKRRYWID